MPRRDHLRSLLQALTPADLLERDHQMRMLRLLDESEAPFSRAQFVPGHVTASGFVVNPARDAVLLILHAKLGRWLQPGGHVEANDPDVAGAAVREVAEEVGLQQLTPQGVLDVDVHTIAACGGQPQHSHFDVRFLFTAKDENFAASGEVRAARWVPITELVQPNAQQAASLAHDESVLRAVRKLMQRAS
jgi:8-oxo-dGTP pyrophosphatase MutT (NUDIX family)